MLGLMVWDARLIFSTSSAGASSFRKSSDSQAALPPLLSISARTPFSNSAFPAASITAAPSSASFNAMALPIPRLAPVTMATLFDNVCPMSGEDKASIQHHQPQHFGMPPLPGTCIARHFIRSS